MLMLISFNSNQTGAQSISWSEHVAPIIFDNCSPCHHSSGAGHSDLSNYDTASYQSAAIQYSVNQKLMPPWPPDPSYKRYAHERTLTQTEINTITDWVSNGTILGDTNLLPPTPIYNGSAILTQTPDLVLQMPNFSIPSNLSSDLYWNFVIPVNNSQDVLIDALEFLAGNTEQVHHALIYVDTGQTIQNLDNNTPGPGFPGFGGAGTSTAKLIGAYVPGTQPFIFPHGFGMRIPANASIIFNMHYPIDGAGQIDSSKLNLFFSNAPTIREVFLEPVLNHSANMVNGPLYIPANTTKTFYQNYTVPTKVSIFGVAPHMHKIGQRIKTYAVRPNNNDTLPLINIPDWDFRWQGMYYFPKLEVLQNNDQLWSEAYYNNTSSNLDNPSNPPQNVSLGEATTDEMMLTYFAYSFYQPGDENIILDSNVAPTSVPSFGFNDQELFPPYPNPARDELNLKFFIRSARETELKIFNMNGQVLWSKKLSLQKKYNIENINVSSWPEGLYLIQMGSAEHVLSQKFLKQD